ncbi:MAG: hypothetical protein DYG94_10710, partial [Leptolyngbya sp. PLA3]
MGNGRLQDSISSLPSGGAIFMLGRSRAAIIANGGHPAPHIADDPGVRRRAILQGILVQRWSAGGSA